MFWLLTKLVWNFTTNVINIFTSKSLARQLFSRSELSSFNKRFKEGPIDNLYKKEWLTDIYCLNMWETHVTVFTTSPPTHLPPPPLPRCRKQTSPIWQKWPSDLAWGLFVPLCLTDRAWGWRWHHASWMDGLHLWRWHLAWWMDGLITLSWPLLFQRDVRLDCKYDKSGTVSATVWTDKCWALGAV